MLKPNRFRQALAAGRVPLGHMVWEFGTRGIAKLLIGIARGRKTHDKRHAIAERDAKREMDRAKRRGERE